MHCNLLVYASPTRASISASPTLVTVELQQGLQRRATSQAEAAARLLKTGLLVSQSPSTPVLCNLVPESYGSGPSSRVSGVPIVVYTYSFKTQSLDGWALSKA